MECFRRGDTIMNTSMTKPEIAKEAVAGDYAFVNGLKL
jgi:hypothetical protein